MYFRTSWEYIEKMPKIPGTKRWSNWKNDNEYEVDGEVGRFTFKT